MSDDCDNCGKDHEEVYPHEDIVGGLGVALTILTNEELVAVMRQMITEMFIRTHPDDDFMESNWDLVDEDVREMFNPETTPQRDVLDEYQELRNEFHVKQQEAGPALTPEQMEESFEFELNALLGKQGVLADDVVYGNYL